MEVTLKKRSYVTTKSHDIDKIVTIIGPLRKVVKVLIFGHGSED